MESKSFMVNTRRSGTLDRQHNCHHKNKNDDLNCFEIDGLQFNNNRSDPLQKKSENSHSKSSRQKSELKIIDTDNDDDDIVEIELNDFKSKRHTQSFMMPKNFLDDDPDIKTSKHYLDLVLRTSQSHHNDDIYIKTSIPQKHPDISKEKQFSVTPLRQASQPLDRNLENLKEDSELSKLNYYNTKAEVSILNQFQEDSLLEHSNLDDSGYEIRDLNITNNDSNGEKQALNIYPDLKSNDIHLKNDLTNDYFKTLVYNTVDFIQTLPPKELTVRCKVIVIKGIFNEYLFYIEDDFNDYLLLRAMRKKTFKQLYFSIVVSNTDQSYKFGTLYSDFSRNNFIITGNYDSGNKSSEKKYADVEFTTKYIGSTRPKDLNIEIVLFDKSTKHKDEEEQRSVGAMFHRTTKSNVCLTTKKPIYDSKTRTYKLKFEGRVKIPSSNNLQLIDNSNPEDILFQMGKLKSKCYSCDFKYPFCAMNAFGLAVTCLSRT